MANVIHFFKANTSHSIASEHFVMKGATPIESVKEEEKDILDPDYKRYPNNPFSTSTREKLYALLNQVADIKNRYRAYGDDFNLLVSHNATLWKEGEPEEIEALKKYSEFITKKIPSGHLVSCEFRVLPLVDDKTLPHVYSNIELDPSMYETRLEDTVYTFPHHAKNKTDITKDDVDDGIKYVAKRLYRSFINLRDFSIESLFFDARPFPNCIAYIRLKAL